MLHWNQEYNSGPHGRHTFARHHHMAAFHSETLPIDFSLCFPICCMHSIIIYDPNCLSILHILKFPILQSGLETFCHFQLTAKVSS
jgi:hypothetical protein